MIDATRWKVRKTYKYSPTMCKTFQKVGIKIKGMNQLMSHHTEHNMMLTLEAQLDTSTPTQSCTEK